MDKFDLISTAHYLLRVYSGFYFSKPELFTITTKQQISSYVYNLTIVTRAHKFQLGVAQFSTIDFNIQNLNPQSFQRGLIHNKNTNNRLCTTTP